MKIISKKHLGQNFLIDPVSIYNIIRYSNIVSKDHVVEIGAGFGSLTYEILSFTNSVYIIEIDYNLILELINRCPRINKTNIINKDVLQVDFKKFYNGKKLKIIGSLPYNIFSLILFHLIKFVAIVDDMYFILQKEVVERIIAKKHNTHYGRLSVMMQYHYHCTKVLDLPKYVFYPMPKVNSQMLHLRPIINRKYVANNYLLFCSLVKYAFQYRRKKLKNTLKYFLKNTSFLHNIPCDINLRPDALDIYDFIKISNYINN